MRGGYYLPRGRKYFRVWYFFEGKKYWIQHSVYGERLWSEDQCREVLNAVAKQIKDKSHRPQEWTKDSILKFEKAWEIFDQQSLCSPTTKEYRNQTCRQFLLPYFQRFSLRQIEEENIKDWFSTLPQKYSPQYLTKIKGVLKTFLNFHRITWVKRLRYPKVSIPSKTVPRLSQEDQARVLEFVPEWHKGIINFIITYGCRVSEACNLRRQDVDLSKGIFTFRERKNKKDHELPILPHIESVLRDRKSVEHFELVFCTRLGRRYARQTVTTIWREANRQAHEKYGVKILTLKNGSRHSKACQLLNENASFAQIARILGNTAGVIEKSYGRYETEKIKEILNITQTGRT